jgi:hypothetical protein
MAGPEPKSVWKSVAVLIGAAVAGYAAFRVNAPVPKSLKFEVTCERFPVVGSMSLNFYQHRTELDSVVADDFLATATDVAAITLPQDKKNKARRPSTTTLALEPTIGPNDENSHLSLVRRGVVNGLSMIVRAPAELTGTTASSPGAPWMTVESREAGDTALTVQSAEIVIREANRYRIPAIGITAEDPQFVATLTGQPFATLKLDAKGKPRTYASLIFKPTDTQLPLLRNPEQLEPGLQLTFARAMNPTLLLDDRRIEGIPADQRVNITAAWSTATIDDISVIHHPEQRGLPSLRIAGSATVSSLRIDGREYVTTRLDAVLNEPVASRTTSLLVLGVIVAFVLKVVDHALGVILEKVIPKGK